jgi:hypothetical protein
VSSSLTLLAGPDALRLIRERGLRAEDVDVLPGASGGAKWLVLAGLDRYLFGELLAQPRERPMHLIGSSIGSWRMACLAQRDPIAALGRGHRAYIYEQRYSPKPSTAEVGAVLSRALDLLLGPTGVDEIKDLGVVQHAPVRDKYDESRFCQGRAKLADGETIAVWFRVFIRRRDNDFGGVRPCFAKYNPPHITDCSKDEAAQKPR